MQVPKRVSAKRELILVVWTGIVATIAAIVLLIFMGSSASTGWRIYVLEEVLRIGWATTAAILVAALSVFILRSLLPPDPRSRGSTARAIFNLLSSAAAFIAALVTISHFMSPWDASTAIPAAVVLLIWGLAAVAAIGGRSSDD
jgi:peptidoglycan biosynthesis protein MviN/MurJ (putative lipid II flippase)